MSAQQYAEFLERMGHHVVAGQAAWWFDAARGIYQSFPFHRAIAPGLGEINRVLGLRGVAVRFPCLEGAGRASYRIVCAAKGYDFPQLTSKARNQTRRGLESCRVLRMSFLELERHGILEVNRDTALRQGRPVAQDADERWRKYYQTAEQTATMEAWVSLVGDQVGAYLIACRIDECFNILVVRSHRQHLKVYPNNALVYTVTKEALARPEVDEVSFGLESVQSELDSLDHFKEGMGYEKVAIGQRIELNRLLRPLMRGPVLRGVSRFAERRQGAEKFAKLAGMMRWYAEQPRRRAG